MKSFYLGATLPKDNVTFSLTWKKYKNTSQQFGSSDNLNGPS
jgi:hypothetical protein